MSMAIISKRFNIDLLSTKVKDVLQAISAELKPNELDYTNGYSLQPTCAQSRMPMDRIVSGACASFFHASHAASTIVS